jgi:hypothetical protein
LGRAVSMGWRRALSSSPFPRRTERNRPRQPASR